MVECKYTYCIKPIGANMADKVPMGCPQNHRSALVEAGMRNS